jgi:chromosome segregation ATPase
MMQSGIIHPGLILLDPLQIQNRNLQASINSLTLELQTMRGIASKQQADLSVLVPLRSSLSAECSKLTMEKAVLQIDLENVNRSFQSLSLMCEDLKTKYESLILEHEDLKREKALIQHQIVRDAARFQTSSTEIFEIGFTDGGKWGKKQADKELEELRKQLDAMMNKNRALEASQQDYDLKNASASELRTKWVRCCRPITSPFAVLSCAASAPRQRAPPARVTHAQPEPAR